MLGFLGGLPATALMSIGIVAGAGIGVALQHFKYEGFLWFDGALAEEFSAGEKKAAARCRTAELEAAIAELTRQKNAGAQVLEEQRRRAAANRLTAEIRQGRIDDLTRKAEAESNCRATGADVDELHDAWGTRRGKGPD